MVVGGYLLANSKACVFLKQSLVEKTQTGTDLCRRRTAVLVNCTLLPLLLLLLLIKPNPKTTFRMHFYSPKKPPQNCPGAATKYAFTMYCMYIRPTYVRTA